MLSGITSNFAPNVPMPVILHSVSEITSQASPLTASLNLLGEIIVPGVVLVVVLAVVPVEDVVLLGMETAGVLCWDTVVLARGALLTAIKPIAAQATPQAIAPTTTPAFLPPFFLPSLFSEA